MKVGKMTNEVWVGGQILSSYSDRLEMNMMEETFSNNEKPQKDSAK